MNNSFVHLPVYVQVGNGPVQTLPVAPLWCDLGFFQTVVVIKLLRTSAL